MVTINIRPYTARKVSFIGLALFCLSCLSTFAQSTYISVHSTPYGRQMARIRPILAFAAGHREQNLSFALVNHWIGDLRAIPYGFSIGKRLPTSQKTHAWLEWSTTGGTYILDPTINWAACRADRSGRMSYIPLYAYAGGQKFRAATTSILYAKNQFLAGRRVASRL